MPGENPFRGKLTLHRITGSPGRLREKSYTASSQRGSLKKGKPAACKKKDNGFKGRGKDYTINSEEDSCIREKVTTLEMWEI